MGTTVLGPIMSWKRNFANLINQPVRTHSTAVDTRDGRTIEAASKRTPKRAAEVLQLEILLYTWRPHVQVDESRAASNK